MRNMASTGNRKSTPPNRPSTLLTLAIDRLRERLPPGWRVESTGPWVPAEAKSYDALVRIEGPDAAAALLALELRTRTSGRIPALTREKLPRAVGRTAVPVLVAPFVPPALQMELQGQQVGYIDATGNLDIRISRPGLFLSAVGALKNPWPVQRPARTLRSAKAARVVRVLTDMAEPFGVRQIASIAATDPGYVSRILAMLEQDGLIVAEPRGPTTKVYRGRLVRRWASDYQVWSTNRVLRLFEPRDLSTLALRIRDLAREDAFRYAITGSWAASRFAPVAATRLLACFVDDPEVIAGRLSLRVEEQVGNVWLIAPFDPVVYERPQREQGITIAAPAQVLVDLMTSPGRAPSEADAYLAWLQENEELWGA